MIGHLISTIIMALGVATGNISSNAYKGGNAFNNELKSQPIKRAAEQNYEYNYVFQSIDSYERQDQTQGIAKLYLKEQNQTVVTPNVSNIYYNLTNTTYYLTKRYDNVHNRYYVRYTLVSIYDLTTYFNTENMDLKLTQHYYYSNQNNEVTQMVRTIINYISSVSLDDYINMTLTDTTVDTLIANVIENGSIQTYTDSGTTQLGNYSAYDESYQNDYVISGITGNSRTYIVQIYEIALFTNYTTTILNGIIVPGSLKITATALLPTVNYEVVDIPNLMYTIITLPFSFISTAFNLTVFGGTPYALNFGNLFLTVIAAFILLWIISKVLKR